ncbi:MAG: hypothetical protein AAGK97_00865, partial [Bacteroidota bacterium]
MKKTVYTQIFMKTKSLFLLSLFCLLFWNFAASQVHSYNQDIFNDCGSNTTIETFAKGILGSSDNCITFDNTNATRTIAEVWIQESQCTGGFPSFITISNGTVSQNVQGIDAAQNSSSSISERLYRVVFDGSSSEICATNLFGCQSTSIVIYVEKTETDASSTLRFINVELDDNFTPVGSDDCITESFQVGGSQLPQDFAVLVPVHEKDDNVRAVRVSATAIDANGQIITSLTETYNSQNAGSQAALFELNLNNISNVATINVEVCSQDPNGDSFGVGA